ncbi:hypothetical protein [Corynebacterium sp. A21]|uniref:hypothetical protein n=1 Tax=Corynebacterium sp. A21 TaxID=3457318 RepID=UPI003FD1E4C7
MNTNHKTETTIKLPMGGGDFRPSIRVVSDLTSPTDGREVEMTVSSGHLGIYGGGPSTVSLKASEAQDLLEALSYHLNAISRTEF